MWSGRRRRPLRDRYRPVWVQEKSRESGFFLFMAIESGGFYATASKNCQVYKKCFCFVKKVWYNR